MKDEHIPDAASVPCVPNQAEVCGEILGITPLPQGGGMAWKVVVHEARDVPSFRNLVKARLGKSIDVFVSAEISETFKCGDRIIARIFFEGDEHGGGFFITNGQVSRRDGLP